MKTKVELQPNVKAFLIKHRSYKRFVKNVEQYLKGRRYINESRHLMRIERETCVSDALFFGFIWATAIERDGRWPKLHAIVLKEEGKAL